MSQDTHPHDHGCAHDPAAAPHVATPTANVRLSALAWPAWRRVLAIVPVVIALWLAVWWANMGASPW